MDFKLAQPWLSSLAAYAIVLGAWGAFPKPPDFLMRLANFELFRWFLVFALIYQATHDSKQSLLFTVVLYLMTKLFELREITNAPVPMPNVHIQTAQAAAAQAAAQATATVTDDKHVAAQAAQTAAEKVEKFYGGYF